MPVSVAEQTPVNASSPGPRNRAGRAAGAWLRRDWPVITLLALGTVVMTYPLILKLGDEWVPAGSTDMFMKFWDMWWFGHMLRTGQPAYYTRDMFYPVGLNLTYHSISWTVSALGWLLAPVFGYLTAYKITILVAVFTTAYAGYLLIYSLVKNRAAACLGGAIYSFAPYHIAHTKGHPVLTHLAPIPLTVLLLTEALTGGSILAALGAALMLGVAALTSPYILDFALLTIFPVFIYLALGKRRWKEAQFWRTTTVFAVASALALTARLWPMLRDLGAFTYATGQIKITNRQADLLAFVIPPSSNPVLQPLAGDIAEHFGLHDIPSKGSPPYLGLIPATLTLSALTHSKHRRPVLVWLIIGLLFATLSLGTYLLFAGHRYKDIILPLAYLTWLPPLETVRPNAYHLGLLLPLAVCSAYGLDRWLVALGQRRRIKSGLVAALSLLLLFEYWNGPYPIERLSISPFYTQVASEEGEFALIDRPADGQPQYMRVLHVPANRPPQADRGGQRRARAGRRLWLHRQQSSIERLEGVPDACVQLRPRTGRPCPASRRLPLRRHSRRRGLGKTPGARRPVGLLPCRRANLSGQVHHGLQARRPGRASPLPIRGRAG
jgi:hypothetical protein